MHKLKRFSFKVLPEESGIRIDRLIVSKIKILSRNSVQKLVKERMVKVNGRLIDRVSYKVKSIDYIELFYSDYLKKKDLESIKPQKMKLNIIYRDSEIVVLDKQAGISMHPPSKEKTIISGLAYYYPDILKIMGNERYGIVHRIDKDTSGIVIVALNKRMHWYLTRQFELREVKKTYIAIVHGDAMKLQREKSKVFSAYIGRDKAHRKRFTIVDKDKGKISTTRFYFLLKKQTEEFGLISLIVAQPITGRTHQIRVHLKSLNLPIVGDKLYGLVKCRDKSDMLLHSYKIGLKMPTGEKKEFTTKYPIRFAKFFSEEEFKSKMQFYEKYIFEN